MKQLDNNSEMGKVEEPSEDYSAYKDFTTLACWKDAREVKLFFNTEIIPRLPREAKYNIENQIRNAFISVTANIAEGYGRFHYKEGIQFYRVARGSLYELKDHLISCRDLDYVSEDIYQKGIELIEKAKISLNGYIKYVQNKIK
jgi:four helix bundle protein